MSDKNGQQTPGNAIPASGTSDLGAVVISALLVIIGAVTLIDTADYLDTDSVVFPRAAAMMLIICAVSVAVISFMRGPVSGGFGSGQWWRRLLLVGSMIIACLLMPLVSFLPAVAVSFVGALLAATHHRISFARICAYGLASIVIVIGFYLLFRYGLQVPLP